MMCTVDLVGTRLEVDGKCLDSAHPVMSVQSTRMWCLQGARSLEFHIGCCEVSNLSKQMEEEGQEKGEVRWREQEREVKRKRERVCIWF